MIATSVYHKRSYSEFLKKRHVHVRIHAKKLFSYKGLNETLHAWSRIYTITHACMGNPLVAACSGGLKFFEGDVLLLQRGAAIGIHAQRFLRIDGVHTIMGFAC